MAKAIKKPLVNLPVIALVGRPNVGKSTLFNRLTKTRDALVADFPGLTRDRQFGKGMLGGESYLVVDTGGLSFKSDGVESLMVGQTQKAIEDSDLILFMVDGKQGICSDDEAIVKQLRRHSKPVILVVNKIDGRDPDLVCSEFFQLGIGEPFAISASQGRSVRNLIDHVLKKLGFHELETNQEEEQDPDVIRIAVVGRPNVGKSTLVNRMIGEDRVVTFDQPGTTRDSIEVPFEIEDQKYVLIDTAGMRRRSRVKETVEKFSAIKAIQAIENADVVILVMDAREDIVEQDISLLAYVLDAGRSVLIAINKWDGLTHEQRDTVKVTMDRRLEFIDYAEKRFISALHGTGVGHLLELVNAAYRSATIDIKTAELTNMLEAAIQAHSPPLNRGRRIKLRYAHQGGRKPPIIIIHGNQTNKIPQSYSRYLTNHFRKKLKLVGTPIRIEFKSSENPYKDKHNSLTRRQIKQRQRLMKHVKKSKK